MQQRDEAGVSLEPRLLFVPVANRVWQHPACRTVCCVKPPAICAPLPQAPTTALANAPPPAAPTDRGHRCTAQGGTRNLGGCTSQSREGHRGGWACSWARHATRAGRQAGGQVGRRGGAAPHARLRLKQRPLCPPPALGPYHVTGSGIACDATTRQRTTPYQIFSQ